MAPDVVVDTGHRDAAFLMQDRLGRCPNDLRIDIGPRAIDGVEVEHRDPQRDADMRRGSPARRASYQTGPSPGRAAHCQTRTRAAPGARAEDHDSGQSGGWS